MDAALWDAVARVERRHWWFRARRDILASLLSRRLASGASVLDVGCGTGYVLERLAESFDAWGVEPEAAVRARAGARTRKRIVPGSAGDFSALGDRRFDAVLLLDVVEHIEDDVAALRAAATMLAPGGFLLATVPAFPSLWSSHDERNGHHRRYTRDLFRSRLAAAGLIPVLLTHFNARLFPVAVAHRLLSWHRSRASERELALPAERTNELLYRVFAGEARGIERGYPFGLSLVAIAEPSPRR